jgi:hypothetical protein
MSVVSYVQPAGGWFRNERDHPKQLAYLPCSICGNPVRLETSKTDELGNAVHEECYITKVRRPTERLPEHTPRPSQRNARLLAA